MNVEEMTWAALSGAVLTLFWPWLVAQEMIASSQAAANEAAIGK